MSIDLYWDNDEQTVLLAEFVGKWTWDELHAMLQTVKRLSQQRAMTFGAIIDVSQGLQLPNGSVFNRDGLANFRKILQLDPDNKGPVTIYGMNNMIRSIFDAAIKIDKRLGENVHFASDMDDARRWVYRSLAEQTANTQGQKYSA
jgi:hypothetical protein